MNKSIAENILRFYIPSIVSFILGLISAIVLTRVFQSEIYGILNVFNVTSALILSFSYLGLDSAYIRFYNEPPAGVEKKQLCFSLLSICIVILLTVGFLVSGFFFDDFSSRIFGFSSRAICIALFCNVMAQLVLRFFLITYRMELNTTKYSIVTIMMQIATKFCVVIAAVFATDILKVIFFNTFGVFLMMVFMVIVFHDVIIPSERKNVIAKETEVLRYGLIEAPSPIVTQLNLFLSQQLIKYRFGMGAVGIYSSANYFVTIFGVLQSGFATFWSAYVYANYKKEQQTIKNIHEYLLVSVIFIYASLILGRDIIYLLIGTDYHLSKEFFSMILFYPIMILLTETTGSGIYIKKKNYIILITNIISSLVNLFIAFVVSNYFGLKGVAFAYGMSGLFYYIVSTIFGQKYYVSINNRKKSIIGIVILCLMMLTSSMMKNGVMYILVALEMCIAILIYRKTILTLIKRLLAELKKKQK